MNDLEAQTRVLLTEIDACEFKATSDVVGSAFQDPSYLIALHLGVDALALMN